MQTAQLPCVAAGDPTPTITWRRVSMLTMVLVLGPDFQNILRQYYDYLTIMPKLRLTTYDERLIYKTSYERRKAFLSYDSLANCEVVR